MIPAVGSTCLFTFILKFETLSGVYRIRAETTFPDAIEAGVDFVEKLYKPAGLGAADFNTDYPGYLKDRIVVLESVKDNNVVYYVPESAFGKVPDPTIKEYFPLVAVINLGVYANTQEIFPVLDQITDVVQSSLGISDPLMVVSNPNNKSYLTDAEYHLLETARKENINKLVPLSVQLKQALEDKATLATLVALYEQRLGIQSTS